VTAATSLPEARPSLVASWILAARPKTLSAASVPVVVGSACACAVQAGLSSPGAMKRGMFVVFALALLIGAYLTAVAGPVILAIGIASILSAIAYTGGPYPLGYNGLGDLFVFFFFGLVAVPGTVFVQLGQVPTLAVWCALPVGALATAILVVNNLRDHEQDERVGKRTLAVRWGPRAVIYEYGFLLALSYAVPLFLATSSAGGRFVLLPLLTLPLGRKLMRAVATERGRELNARLAGTAKLLLLFGLLFALGIVLDHLRLLHGNAS
jgi:1,4-dihydroxy-2-naphthoate octaprenyltransferase